VDRESGRRVPTAKKDTHRPGLAPALGLRAGNDGFFIVPQTDLSWRPIMFFSSWLLQQNTNRQAKRATAARLRQGRFRPTMELLEDRAVPAVLNVTTSLDVIDPNDGMLSLREAVIQANASNGADTIVLPAGTYRLTRAGANEDLATTGDLDITDSLTIAGAGAESTIIDGSGLDRVFQALGAKSVALSGMTIQGGVADDGGGILASDSFLTIDHCTISGNSSQISPSSNQSFGSGISVHGGTLTVSDSTISGNSSVSAYGILGGGGGIRAFDASVTIDHSTISGNSAYAFGGGIFAELGTLSVKGSTIFGNSLSGVYGGGGGIYLGTVDSATIKDSTISGNSTGPFGNPSGGGIWNSFGGPIKGGGGRLTVSNCTLSGNFAYLGGGILNEVGPLIVSDSTLSGNSASYGGGGIYNYFANLTVNNSTLSGNSAIYGGGIFNDHSAIVTTSKLSAAVTNSTLSGNSAIYGGGIYNSYYSTLTLHNSTLSANFATNNDGVGGGIYNASTGTLDINDSALSANSASAYGGGIANFGNLTLRGSTVLGNFAPLGGDVYNAGMLFVYGSIIDDRYDA
jgi:hypothetical protein